MDSAVPEVFDGDLSHPAMRNALEHNCSPPVIFVFFRRKDRLNAEVFHTDVSDSLWKRVLVQYGSTVNSLNGLDDRSIQCDLIAVDCYDFPSPLYMVVFW